MSLRQAAAAALEAIESDTVKFSTWTEKMLDAATALRQALAEPEQEPVAWMDEFGNVFPFSAQRGPKYLIEPMKPLYTAPTPRKPLTVFEIDAIAEHLDKTTIGWATHEFAAAIERAHGITGETK